MASVTPSSVAPITAVGARNRAFVPSVSLVEQKHLIIGAALAANTSAGTYVADTPVEVFSPDQVGALAGFGSPPHLDALAASNGSSFKCRTFVAIMAEAGTGVAATGTFVITAAPTETGILNFRIGELEYPIAVTSSDTVTTIGDALVAAMAADPNCPFTGVNTTGSVAMTAKSKGTWANDALMTVNALPGEETPAGLTYTITPMASGANDPDVDDVLTVLGTADAANEDHYTYLTVGFGRLVTATLNSLSVYNGTADIKEGCWLDTVHRPFKCIWADTEAGSSGYSTLTALGGTRRELDRTNGVVAVPGSPNFPSGIAAKAAALACSLHNIRPQENYVGQNLVGVIAGARADRWSDTYTSRDTAEKAGVSPTVVSSGTVKLQRLLTFYHPTAVAIGSNAYRSTRNIDVIDNIMYNNYNAFESTEWQGVTIVDDVNNVTSNVDREKVVDKKTVMLALFALVDLYESKSWIASGTWTKEKMAENIDAYIAVRTGGLGFDYTLPLVLSGEGGIMNGEIQFDANTTVVTG